MEKMSKNYSFLYPGMSHCMDMQVWIYLHLLMDIYSCSFNYYKEGAARNTEVQPLYGLKLSFLIDYIPRNKMTRSYDMCIFKLIFFFYFYNFLMYFYFVLRLHWDFDVACRLFSWQYTGCL